MLEHSLELSSQELLNANAEMRAVFQAIPDLAFRIDHQCIILGVKAGTTSDLKLEHPDWVGKRIAEPPLKDVAAKFSEALQRLIAYDAPASIEYSAVLRGLESYYEARLVPLGRSSRSKKKENTVSEEFTCWVKELHGKMCRFSPGRARLRVSTALFRFEPGCVAGVALRTDADRRCASRRARG